MCEERRWREAQRAEQCLVGNRQRNQHTSYTVKASVNEKIDGHKPGQKPSGIWCTSAQIVHLVKYIKTENNGVLHFSGHPSLAIRGEILAESREDTLFVSFTERPQDYTDEELCKLLFRKLLQHTNHENKIRTASKEASRLGEAIPQEFICPITLAVMIDPVLAADGNTYERDAIAEWIERVQRSPLTNLPLTNSILSQNDDLHAAIGRWADQVLEPSDAGATAESGATTCHHI
jgi:hypothetical protein